MNSTYLKHHYYIFYGEITIAYFGNSEQIVITSEVRCYV